MLTNVCKVGLSLNLGFCEACFANVKHSKCHKKCPKYFYIMFIFDIIKGCGVYGMYYTICIIVVDDSSIYVYWKDNKKCMAVYLGWLICAVELSSYRFQVGEMKGHSGEQRCFA